jgi:anti-sigma28 factor (negative regulator of flagellin synthesis)
MSDTPRHTTRRPPVSAPRAAIAAGATVATSPQRVEALRRLVAAGRYDVNPRYLATKIFRAAGVKVPE